MTRPPPTEPGIPAANSRPLRPFARASCAVFASEAPAPAVITFPAARILLKSSGTVSSPDSDPPEAASAAVSVTGLAGPDGDGTGRPVGLVYIAIDAPGFSFCRELHLSGSRAEIRRQAAEAVLQMILELM